MTKPIIVEYYSDLLCVWAWIAQKRIDELNHKLNNKIEIHYHYLDIFGDTQAKMDKQWATKGGFQGFAEHVVESAKPYADVIISKDIWTKTKPSTSANAHLVLKAVELHYGMEKSAELALDLRQAFFGQAKDISNLDVLYALVEQVGLNVELIKPLINNGRAMAALMTDYQIAKQLSLKGSPTYIIDNGRQTLYGNVGYKVLLANIEEQLKRPCNEASWC
jgi:predicted DsbA family dithiol-disulfide isomerase